MWREREKAYQTAVTGDCRFAECAVCGICRDLGVQVSLKSENLREDNLKEEEGRKHVPAAEI